MPFHKLEAKLVLCVCLNVGRQKLWNASNKMQFIFGLALVSKDVMVSPTPPTPCDAVKEIPLGFIGKNQLVYLIWATAFKHRLNAAYKRQYIFLRPLFSIKTKWFFAVIY